MLFVSASGWLGGPGRSLFTLLGHLAERFALTLVSPLEGDLLPAIRARGLAVTHLPLFTLRGRAKHALARVVAIARLTLWIVRHRRDLTAIHANGYSELHLAALGAVLARVPLVAWFHASEADPWDRRLGPIWRRLVTDRRFAAVSDLAREVVVGTGLATAREIAVIPNPIDPRDVGAGERAAGEWSRPLVIGYLGTTIADKGFRLLPDIIRRVNGAAVRWALFVSPSQDNPVREPQVWSELEALGADGRVMVLGRKSDVRDAYRECDLVLCPSFRESFGRIAAEALVNGLPVVASDLAPLRDMIGDDGGLLFPAGDAGAAAAQIQRLVDDRALRAQLGEGGRRRAGAFSPAPIAAEFARLYEREGTGGRPMREDERVIPSTAVPAEPPAELRYKRPLDPRQLLAELWSARELVLTLAERELRVRYKQAVLGAAWALLTPLALMVVFALFLQRVAHFETHGAPYALFSYLGLVPWTFFSTSVSVGGQSLVSNAGLLNKVHCPREVFPFANVLIASVDMLVSGIALLALFAITRFPPSLTSLWLPIPLAVQIAFTVGVTLIISSGLVYLRDLRHALPIVLQLGLFATPVAYGIEVIPTPLRTLYAIVNPLAPVIDSYRRTVLYGQPPDWSLLVPGAISAFVVLIVGYAIFKRLETNFADVA